MTGNLNRKSPFLGISVKFRQKLSNTALKNIYETVHSGEIRIFPPRTWWKINIYGQKTCKKGFWCLFW